MPRVTHRQPRSPPRASTSGRRERSVSNRPHANAAPGQACRVADGSTPCRVESMRETVRRCARLGLHGRRGGIEGGGRHVRDQRPGSARAGGASAGRGHIGGDARDLAPSPPPACPRCRDPRDGDDAASHRGACWRRRSDGAVHLGVHRGQQQQQGGRDLQRDRLLRGPGRRRLQRPDVLQRQPDGRPDHQPRGHDRERRCPRRRAVCGGCRDPRPGGPDQRVGLVQRRRRRPAPQGHHGHRLPRPGRVRSRH